MTDAELEEIFTYQNCAGIPEERFTEIRRSAKLLAWSINEHGGLQRDKDIAFQKLRECVHFAIASICFEKSQDQMPY